MGINYFIFFTISIVLILTLIGTMTVLCFKEYYSDAYNDYVRHKDTRRARVLPYVGNFIGITLLIMLILAFVLLLLSLFFSLQGRLFLIYIVKYLESNFFKLLLLITVIISIVCIVYQNYYYSYSDIRKLGELEDKYNGLKNALNNTKKSLRSIEQSIADRESNDNISKELEKNKAELKKIIEKYTIEMKQLEHIKTKLKNKLEENNVTTENSYY